MLGLIFLFGFQVAVVADLASLGIIPLNLTGGARYMGLGGAGAALAYNADAIFSNPGSLAWSKGIFANLRDMENISAGQSYPTGYGQTVSLGFYKSGVNKLILPPSPTEYTISDNTIILSAGARLSSIPQLANNEIAKNLGVGLNMKILTWQNLAQTGAFDRTSNGADADIGILYYNRRWLSFGASLFNFIPSSGGGLGTLQWNDGQKESIPRILKFGAAAKVLGGIGAPWSLEDRELLISTDVEMQKATLFHLGCEFKPFSFLSLRAGLAQRYRNDQVQSDPSVGLGWQLSGWTLDWTSTKDPIKGDSVTYFSIIYFPEAWFFMAQPIEKISLKDMMETYSSTLEITGKVYPGTKLFINGVPVEVQPDGSFRHVVKLKVGENLINVETDYDGERQVRTYHVYRNPPPESPVEEFSLLDNQTVYESDLEISGKLAKGVKALFINGVPVEVDENGNFRITVPLKPGKNIIKVEGLMEDGTRIVKYYTVYLKVPPKPKKVKPPVEKIVRPKPVVRHKRALTKAELEKLRLEERLRKERELLESYLAKQRLEAAARVRAEMASLEAQLIMYRMLVQERLKAEIASAEATLREQKALAAKLLRAEAQRAVEQVKREKVLAGTLIREEKRFTEERLKREREQAAARLKVIAASAEAHVKQQKMEAAEKLNQEKELLQAQLLEEKKAQQEKLEKERQLAELKLNAEKTLAAINLQRERAQAEARLRIEKTLATINLQRELAQYQALLKKEKEKIERKLGEEKQNKVQDEARKKAAQMVYKELKAQQETERQEAKAKKLQDIIRSASGITIVKKVKVKLPKGYLAVYITSQNTFVVLRHMGAGKVAIEHYQSSTGEWSHMAYVPYSKIKNLL
jgi:hypothetical protein